jgi:hypothetical protein
VISKRPPTSVGSVRSVSCTRSASIRMRRPRRGLRPRPAAETFGQPTRQLFGRLRGRPCGLGEHPVPQLDPFLPLSRDGPGIEETASSALSSVALEHRLKELLVRYGS